MNTESGIAHVGMLYRCSYEQALVSLKLKKTVDAEGWCTKAVKIEGG